MAKDTPTNDNGGDNGNKSRNIYDYWLQLQLMAKNITELQISGMEPVSYAQNSVNNNSICNSYIYFVIVTNNNQI